MRGGLKAEKEGERKGGRGEREGGRECTRHSFGCKCEVALAERMLRGRERAHFESYTELSVFLSMML